MEQFQAVNIEQSILGSFIVDNSLGEKLNDLKENPDFEYIILGSGEGGLNSDDVSSSEVIPSGESVGSSSGKIGSGSSSAKQVVNINSASQTELELLPRYWSFSCS